MYSDVRGVCSAGLITKVFPQHSAGAIFQTSISNGKFHCKNTRLVRSAYHSHLLTSTQYPPHLHTAQRGRSNWEESHEEKCLLITLCLPGLRSVTSLTAPEIPDIAGSPQANPVSCTNLFMTQPHSLQEFDHTLYSIWAVYSNSVGGSILMHHFVQCPYVGELEGETAHWKTSFVLGIGWVVQSHTISFNPRFITGKLQWVVLSWKSRGDLILPSNCKFQLVFLFGIRNQSTSVSSVLISFMVMCICRSCNLSKKWKIWLTESQKAHLAAERISSLKIINAALGMMEAGQQ